MKIMFTVQGDGRGHMTQALAAAQIFESQGHEIVAVTIGRNRNRSVPEYFARAFGGRLTPIASAGFSFRGGKGVATMGTLRQTFSELGEYRASLHTLAAIIQKSRPDLIVNFLEPLMGAFNLLRPHRVPVVSVGHHFMLDHPEFVRSNQYAMQQWAMRQYVRLSGARSTKLALSFYQAPSMPERGLFVCPPLLRAELFDLQSDPNGKFLLAYVLNQAYTEEILRWHSAFPDVELHCFCEKPKIEPVWRYDATLSFHKLDGAKFLRMMAGSRGVACTAGFESLNEAAWLGKPLLVVPVENHVEQYFNALDAEKAGLAIAARTFDLTPLLRRPKAANLETYRNWVRQAGSVALSVIERVTRKSVRHFLPPRPAAVCPGLVLESLGEPLLELHSLNKSGGTPAPAVSTAAASAR